MLKGSVAAVDDDEEMLMLKICFAVHVFPFCYAYIDLFIKWKSFNWQIVSFPCMEHLLHSHKSVDFQITAFPVQLHVCQNR